jgi:hypothetical protein
MTLADLIRGDFGRVATAIPAIGAIAPGTDGESVAGVATVAVANPGPPWTVKPSLPIPTFAPVDLQRLLGEVATLYGCTADERLEMTAAAERDREGAMRSFRAMLAETASILTSCVLTGSAHDGHP